MRLLPKVAYALFMSMSNVWAEKVGIYFAKSEKKGVDYFMFTHPEYWSD